MSYIADKADTKANILARFRALESRMNGTSASAIHEVRKLAINSFEKTGLPGVKNEEYKYTHISRALEKEFGLPIPMEGKIQSAIGPERLLFEGLDANILVFVNGIYSEEQSRIISPEEEIIIRELSEASKVFTKDIEAHFAQYTHNDNDAFTALNTAFAKGGAFVKIPDNKIGKKPLVLYFISNGSDANNIAYPRNLILAGKNSQSNIIEVFHSSGSNPNFTNTVSEIILDENANLDYNKIELEGERSYHVGNTQVYQAKASTFNAVTITLSGKLIRNNLNVVLDAEGCETHMNGLYLLNGNQHVDNHTVVDHRKPHSESNELYKGILDDKSTGVFNGKIYVRPDAQMTNAFQSNKNILLSDDATINTKPQLEIWADDVKCSHGATTGQIDKEQLFYLRARGLSEESARAILLYAFAADVLGNIKVEPLKKFLDDIISERLHKDF